MTVYGTPRQNARRILDQVGRELFTYEYRLPDHAVNDLMDWLEQFLKDQYDDNAT